MAYLQELIQEQNRQVQQQGINSTNFIGLRPGEAYAQYFPTWEVTAPQYQVPIAWSLSQLGYRTNEVAYACISLKMKTISEPPLRIYDKVEEEFIDDSKNEEFFRFMEQPCPDITETDFHAANQMYLDIAGVLAWEKDTTNNGSLKAIWPMMPQYCSYLRGEAKLLRAIRYQPYTGLPYLDIPRERVVLMMYFDPNYFGLKPLGPTAIMADVIKVDNDMTTMLQTFIQNGAFVSGILSTEQVINEADAKFAKERFRESHGGPNNAGDVVVTGKGLKFERMGQTFREMVFPEVDARSETRICMGYSVPPILVSAKSGMDRATYSNYEQARKAWYEEYVTSQWKFLAERYTKDLLPHFDADVNHVLKFDTSKVKALQEDRTAAWARADSAFKDRVVVRNVALVEMGLPPLGDSDPAGLEYYEVVMAQTSTSQVTKNDLDKPNVDGTTPQRENEMLISDKNKATDEQKVDEEKKFRAFAKRRIKENKSQDIGEYEFLYLDEKKQRQLKSEFGVPDPEAKMVLDALLATVKALNTQNYQQPNINITANIEPGQSPSVTVENKIPEQKAIQPKINVEVNPTPVNVNIEPTPIQNNIVTPKIKKSKSFDKVKRDGANNIDGKMSETEYEYEE